MEKYYKVKTGYGKNDFLSVPEEDLVSALRAQTTGKVFISSETGESIRGNDIIGITADWNRFLGFNQDYQLTGEDISLISRGVRREFEQAQIEARSTVTGVPLRLLTHDE